MRNHIWKILIFIMLVSLSYYFFQLGSEIYRYQAVSSSALAQHVDFQVKEAKSDNYRIGAVYTFVVKDKTYKSSCVFEKPIFLNEISAKKHVELWKNRTWTVYYKAKNPEISTLQKIFPVKRVFQAVVMVFLVLYFWGFKHYLMRHQRA